MNNNSINTNILIVAIAPIFLVLILVSGLFISNSIQDLEDSIQQRGENLVNQASKMLEFYLFSGDLTRAEEIANVFIALDDVSSFNVMEQKQPLIYREKDINASQIEFFSQTITTEAAPLDDFSSFADFNNESKIISLGLVTIGLSRDYFDKKQNKLFLLIIGIGVFALLLALIMAYFLSHRLRTSLNSLIAASKRIEKREFEKACEENGAGELLQLQKTFNQMSRSIQIKDQELQEKIDQATYSLKDTIEQLSLSNNELSELRKETIQLERSKAISDERSRIMQDVHDGIGGQLVATLAILEKEEKTETRNNIAEILSACLADFRLIINSLNNDTNTLDQLLADFKYRNTKYLASLNITLDWQVEDTIENITLSPSHSLHLLRCLQEVFSNIYKHAKATHLEFKVSLQNTHVLFHIADNGKCTAIPNSQRGFGLNHLKQRMLQLNGDVDFQVNNPSGLIVLLSLPNIV